ncbi:hypothetical protein ACQU0X_25905 [Pseudovibrio ascidiaceicola]|uniref:hypothetical protein n=1 Tax=Pseudovibrio ascidiaceicola TaxID=285279 RepID=UPI003D3605B9
MAEYLIRASGRICVASGDGAGDYSFCGDAWDRVDDNDTLTGDLSEVAVETKSTGGYNCSECRSAIEATLAAVAGAEFNSP